MPQLAPISLTIGENTEVYNPSAFSGTVAKFTDTSPGRLSEWRLLNFTVRPAAKGNSGHLVEALLVRPIPAEDQEGCCVDHDNIPASTIRITTLLSKSSSAEQATELVEALQALTNDSSFIAVIKGQSFY